jgi:hypothetical protein
MALRCKWGARDSDALAAMTIAVGARLGAYEIASLVGAGGMDI